MDFPQLSAAKLLPTLGDFVFNPDQQVRYTDPYWQIDVFQAINMLGLPLQFFGVNKVIWGDSLFSRTQTYDPANVE